MNNFASIKTSPTEFKHFKVPKEVMTYIIQLENAVRNKKIRKNIRKIHPKLNKIKL